MTRQLGATTVVWRYGREDGLLVGLALAHGAVLWAWPFASVIGVLLWWNSQTVSHYFIHRPYFRARALNVAFSAYLSLLLGFPQSIWRDKHLAHHAEVATRVRRDAQLALEIALCAVLWGSLGVFAPALLVTAWLPGFALGMALCALHGHYEHAHAPVVSNYGFVSNLLFLNDGHHAEHHAHPGEHWRRLPRHRQAGTPTSRWPAVLRFLDGCALAWLERRVLRSSALQRLVLRCHERALRRLLARSPRPPRRVAIVGGGLFPRTGILLRRILPEARLVVLDGNAEHVAIARDRLDELGIESRNEWFDAARHADFDLVVVPLAFRGDRDALYASPPAPQVWIHDWIWRRRGTGAIVSWLLFKRINAVGAGPAPADALAALSGSAAS